MYLLFQAKSAESKKAKKAAAAADGDSDEEEALDEIIEGDSEIESDEYDIPYDGEEDDIECDGELTKIPSFYPPSNHLISSHLI